jgi:hypothetical protein
VSLGYCYRTLPRKVILVKFASADFYGSRFSKFENFTLLKLVSVNRPMKPTTSRILLTLNWSFHPDLNRD